jgi:hypothetical protein
MFAFTLTPAQFHSLVSVTVARPGATERGTSPILDAVQITAAAGTLSAVMTDRYRVARVSFPTTAEDGMVQVPAEFLLSALKSIPGAGIGEVRVVAEPVETASTVDSYLIAVSWEHGGVHLTTMSRDGNFPPVARLIPEEDKRGDVNAGAAFNPAFLAGLGKLKTVTAAGKPAVPATFALYQATPESYTTNRKMTPMYATAGVAGSEYGHVEYLLQPNLIPA